MTVFSNSNKGGSMIAKNSYIFPQHVFWVAVYPVKFFQGGVLYRDIFFRVTFRVSPEIRRTDRQSDSKRRDLLRCMATDELRAESLCNRSLLMLVCSCLQYVLLYYRFPHIWL